MSNNLEAEDLLSKFPNPCELADLLNVLDQQGKDLLSRSSPEVMNLTLEYARLAALENRSEQENESLDTLLEVADHSEILSFWIVEVDHLLGHYLGLLDEDARESYRDQQALLRDYAGTKDFPTPPHKQIANYLCTLKSHLYSPDDNPVPC